jgi:hypothetical protein
MGQVPGWLRGKERKENTGTSSKRQTTLIVDLFEIDLQQLDEFEMREVNDQSTCSSLNHDRRPRCSKSSPKKKPIELFFSNSCCKPVVVKQVPALNRVILLYWKSLPFEIRKLHVNTRLNSVCDDDEFFS